MWRKIRSTVFGLSKIQIKTGMYFNPDSKQIVITQNFLNSLANNVDAAIFAFGHEGYHSLDLNNINQLTSDVRCNHGVGSGKGRPIYAMASFAGSERHRLKVSAATSVQMDGDPGRSAELNSNCRASWRLRLFLWRATKVIALIAMAVPALVAPSLARANWYRGNTHTHTMNSDGDASPDAVVRWYREHDYQFLFITDHEYATDVGSLNALFGARERFLVLPGQEITQWGSDPARSAAHINSLFTTEVIWPVGERTCMGGGCGATPDTSVPLAATFKANIGAVLAAKGIAQINHPNYRWSVRPEDLYDVPSGCLLEIWNGQGRINNLGGTDDHGDARPSAEGLWDILLSRGKVIWGVGSDDSHNYGATADPHGAAPGQAWIVVRAPELTSASLESAIRRGDFYASTGVTLRDVTTNGRELAVVIAEQKPGAIRYITRFMGRNGRTLAEVPGTKPIYRFKGTESYVRAAVIDSNGLRAWTQPVFLDGRKVQ
jgi:hypothetical protein